MVTLARTTILVASLIALMLMGTIIGARAQRCPAGADAFGSCLPLDHRYGGPGQIQRGGPRPEDHRRRAPLCAPLVKLTGSRGKPDDHARWAGASCNASDALAFEA
jgi:hypothetical protein